MSNRTIKPEELQEAIQAELSAYTKEATEQTREILSDAMDDLVERTKTTAPVGKRRRHYKSNITSRLLENTPFSAIYQWYVKGSDYRLSHLLNNGHALRDGGRYAGTQFITKAYEKTEKELETKIESRLSK